MKKFYKYIFYFLICDVSYLVLYYFTKDLIISLFVSLFGLLVFYRVIVPNYSKATSYRSTVEQVNKFINSLIIQLSVTPSLEEALINIKMYCSIEVNDIIDNPNFENAIERVEQIAYHFNHPLMFVFTQQLKVHNEQGGDILYMSQQIVEQVNHLKSSVHLFTSIKKRKLKEFSTIWLFSLLSLLYLRLGLENYFLLVLDESPLFKYSIALSFAILFVSYGIFYRKYGDYYIEKGWDI